MINLATMNHTRARIVSAIDVLSQQNNRLTYEQIAARAECSYNTVKRAIPALLADNKIKRSGNGKGGAYFYEVVW